MRSKQKTPAEDNGDNLFCLIFVYTNVESRWKLKKQNKYEFSFG